MNDPDLILAKYPHLTQAQAQVIAKSGGNVLSQPERAKVLNYLASGMAPLDIGRKMGKGTSSMHVTKLVHPEFKKAWQLIMKSRPRQVESSLYRYATGQVRQTKVFYEAKLDANQEPVVDAKGKQVFWIRKKEVTTIPIPASLLTFYLRCKFPDEYGAKGKDDQDDTMPQEQLSESLEKLKKNLKLAN